MKRFILLCGLLAGATGLLMCEEPPASTMQTSGSESLLFPPNFIRGYVDFEIAPPHNEFDLGLCAPQSGPLPAGRLECAAYARYSWGGYVEVQPFGRGIMRNLYLFAEPKLYGGKNVPQESYTASPALILFEETLGLGWTLPHNLELRLKHHRNKLLGRYGGSLHDYLLKPDGPYGLYTTIGVRWYFGGYGRAGQR
jgi:hypothetical protein